MSWLIWAIIAYWVFKRIKQTYLDLGGSDEQNQISPPGSRPVGNAKGAFGSASSGQAKRAPEPASSKTVLAGRSSKPKGDKFGSKATPSNWRAAKKRAVGMARDKAAGWYAKGNSPTGSFELPSGATKRRKDKSKVKVRAGWFS